MDAFMANEVNAEVRAREEEEAKKREEELKERAKQRAVSCPQAMQGQMPCQAVHVTNGGGVQEGKIPKLDKILEESDEEEQPDAEVQVPEHKVKLVVGPGGEKIKHIQRKSKCRLQVRILPF